MSRREQIILSAALVTILLMTILPPVTEMSYDYSGGITRVSPVIHYQFLFTKSWNEISYQRLFLQYLIVLIASRWLVLSQRKVSASLTTRVAELSVTNDKLLQVITKGKYAGEQLKQKAVELTAAKEKLSRQINELKDAEQKWHTYRGQLEQQIAERRQLEKRLECQSNELKTVGERLQHQMGKLEEAEECFKKQAAELAAVKDAEQQLREYNKQLEQRVEQRTAELSAVNKRLEKQLGERAQEEESPAAPLTECDERLEQPEIKSDLFNVKEMKALAELAKRLSRK